MLKQMKELDPEAKTLKVTCTNTMVNCTIWAAAGLCHWNAFGKSLVQVCPASCDPVCTGKPLPTNPPVTTVASTASTIAGVCADTASYVLICPFIYRSNLCTIYIPEMAMLGSALCPLSCKICTPTSTVSTTTTTTVTQSVACSLANSHAVNGVCVCKDGYQGDGKTYCDGKLPYNVQCLDTLHFHYFLECGITYFEQNVKIVGGTTAVANSWATAGRPAVADCALHVKHNQY